jgi:hypothetical protein
MEYYSTIKKNEIVICGKMDGTEDHRVELDNPSSIGQISYVLTHL